VVGNNMSAGVLHSGATFLLPKPPGLLRWKLHPDYTGILERYTDWIHELLSSWRNDDVDAFRSGRFEMWVCLCFPDVASKIADDLARLAALMFVIDDLTSNEADAPEIATVRISQWFATVIAVMRSGETKHRALIDGVPEYLLSPLEITCGRIRSGMSSPQWSRFMDQLETWAQGSVSESRLRARHASVAFTDYLALRRRSVCVTPWCVLAEYGLGIDLTDFAHFPELRKIHETAVTHAMLTNDLHSFRAEYYKGDFVNAIIVGCSREKMSLQDSVDQVCAMIARAERDFVCERSRVLAGTLGTRPDVRRYLSALEYLLAGNMRWSYLTGRYHGPGYAWNGELSGRVILQPDRTVLIRE
jgi:Terpene synthase family 2, C-terminal metal binding